MSCWGCVSYLRSELPVVLLGSIECKYSALLARLYGLVLLLTMYACIMGSVICRGLNCE